MARWQEDWHDDKRPPRCRGRRHGVMVYASFDSSERALFHVGIRLSLTSRGNAGAKVYCV